VAVSYAPLYSWKTLRCNDASNWEEAMQEEYNSLMANSL
jgi:hypothetical protein